MAQPTYQIRAPDPFVCEDRNRYAAWRDWSRLFRTYAVASRLKKADKDEQICALTLAAGKDIMTLYTNHIEAKLKPTDGYEEVLNKIEALFKDDINLTQSRYEFLNTRQQARSLEAFMIALRNKADECEFCKPCANSLIASTFLTGLEDAECRRHLLTKGAKATVGPDETLKLAKEFTSSKQIETQLAPSEAPIHAVHNRRRTTRRNYPQAQNNRPTDKFKSAACSKGCRSHPGGLCRARNTICHRCRQKGHFANVCETAHSVDEHVTDEADEIEHSDYVQLYEARLDSLHSPKNTLESEDTWWQKLLISNTRESVDFKLDTGASISILPLRIFKKIRQRGTLIPTKKRIVSYSEHEMQIAGYCDLQTCVPNSHTAHKIRFYVVDTNAPPILGLKDSTKLELVKRTPPAASNSQVHQITTSNIVKTFSDVFDGTIGELPAMQEIRLKKPYPPQKVFPPRRVPLRYQKATKQKLDKMEADGIVRRARQPARYVNPLVVVRKADGDLRLCLDPRYLNGHIQRRSFPLPKAEELFATLNGAQFFTVVDADSAFWHLKLDEKSKELCIFATQWGNYQYERLPFGIVDASERFCEAIHNHFADLEGVINSVDDFLIHGRTRQEHDDRLRTFLQRCREKGLKLKKAKLQLACTSVKFLGHTIGRNGIAVPPSRVEGIVAMQAPKDADQVKTFLGMINYVSKFVPHCADRSAALRRLTRSTEPFRWGPEEEKAFRDLKDAVANAPELGIIEEETPITISADASSYGLGAALKQKGRPVAFASVSLNETQRRYSQLEKELLAVVFACEHFRFYLIGTHFDIESDHRPLVSIVRKDISLLSPRLQKMMMRLMRYDYELNYVPGKDLQVADALSRFPAPGFCETSEIDDSNTTVLCSVSMTEEAAERMRRATEEDISTQKAIQYTVRGWPNHKTAVHTSARAYWQCREELHTEDGLLYRGNRLIIPMQERQRVIETLHSAHQGLEKMLQKARLNVYWPSMTADLRETTDNCSICRSHDRANVRLPLQPTGAPAHPWHTVGVDFVHCNGDIYLFAVDYFSKDFLIKKTTSTTAANITRIMREWWLLHGYPVVLVSDNGPPYASKEFAEQMRRWDIRQQLISPGHSRANGAVERHIQTVKNTIIKARQSGTDITEALLSLRTTPLDDGFSPAQISMGRTIRTTLPTSRAQLETPTKGAWNARKQTLDAAAQKAKLHFDRRARELPPLKVHQRVWVRVATRQWKRGVVVNVVHGRAYDVKMDEGGTFRRNREMLRPDRSSPATEETQRNARAEKVPSETAIYTTMAIPTISQLDDSFHSVTEDDSETEPAPHQAIETTESPEASAMEISGVAPIETTATAPSETPPMEVPSTPVATQDLRAILRKRPAAQSSPTSPPEVPTKHSRFGRQYKTKQMFSPK